ncbi:flagellar biosynthesis anti-sigma factor FlgM [Mangrovibacillus cuniculi]|uniref:Negative regulator of flagellin synthesis n=1 Tax=Mangrovibacillus cuniculi TaxID=2593652 RepID=A0A7S8CCQ6_9BACI|nr:flagellar biosynthesis anti-sigma factor FlgM [Mangrovibacillus cuniculi]QPC47517.1 flagellar biosynthesis anti-sigma factor FlgM [Mangrovibacillus cuniculi]
MKINHTNGAGMNPYQRQINKLDAAKAKPKQTDKIEISTTAKEMQQTNNWISDRQKKVDDLKIQVENGTYKPDPQLIAKAMKNYFQK